MNKIFLTQTYKKQNQRQFKTVRVCLFIFIALLIATTHQTTPIQAQQPSQNYWRYSAAREIEQVIVSDVNYDGIDEFIIVTETGRVDLLSSDGVLQWSYRSDSDESVRALNTLNIDATSHSPQEIALITNNQLTLLDDEGNELWQTRLKTAVTPQTLFTNGGVEAEATWEAEYQIQPIDLQPFDYDGDGRDEILLLLNTGQLLLYSGEGQEIWRYADNPLITSDNTRPHIAIGDLDQNGLPEIALGYFNPERRFSELALIGNDGTSLWQRNQPLSGRITAVTLLPFSQDNTLQIAVATDRGDIHLYNHRHERLWWPRTLNKPITALTYATLPEGPALVAGTAVGSVVAYAPTGQRYWTRHLSPEADQPIVTLSAAPFMPGENEPTLAIVLQADTATGRPNDVFLLGAEGRTVDLYEASDTSGLTRILDINRDENSELLLVRFATLELAGTGKGTSEIASEWTYPLDAAPSSMLVIDFDQDGEDELLVGASDGRLHYIKNRAAADWIVAPGGNITHLATINPPAPNIAQPQIVIVRNNVNQESRDEETYQSWIELRTTNGERQWEIQLEERISSLLVHNIDKRGTPEIIVGSIDGDVFIFSSTGDLLWEINFYPPQEEVEPAPITHLRIVQNIQTDHPEIIAVTPNEVYRIRTEFFLASASIAKYEEPIQDIFNLEHQPGHELATALLLYSGSQISGVTWRGIQMPTWPLPLSTTTTLNIPANDIIEEAFEIRPAESFLTATSDNRLFRLNIENNIPTIDWELSGLENVTSLYWGDLDGDALPEFIVGSDEGNSGQVRLYSYQQELIDEIPLASGVFGLDVLRREENQSADILVVSENGDIQLLRAQENRPPLLTDPTTEVTEGQYSVSISVADVESDNVEVRLETKQTGTGNWINQGEVSASTGNERLFWLVKNLPQDGEGVEFRFFYNDGSHQGYVFPEVGPSPIGIGNLWGIDPAFFVFLIIIGSTAVILFIRQTQLPSVRARRFYRQLKSAPTKSLLLLESQYLRSQGSPDLLLSLANMARQDKNRILSNLADGLYLLSDRPHVALPIINSTLENAQKEVLNWQDLARWELIFNTGQALIEAPTVTDLSLLRPQMVALLDSLEEEDHWSPPLGTLLPILTNLRDSERVTRPEDRLVYLTEAVHRLNELQYHLPEFSSRVEKTLTAAFPSKCLILYSYTKCIPDEKAMCIFFILARCI